MLEDICMEERSTKRGPVCLLSVIYCVVFVMFVRCSGISPLAFRYVSGVMEGVC